MTNYPYPLVATVIWAAWALSWWAAGLWTARAAGAAAPASYRPQLLTAFVGYGLLFFEAPARGHRLWLLPPWAGWGTVALTAGAMAFCWWARLHLGRLWSVGIVRREAHRVVDTGPYALVRHPIYTGIIAGAAGLAASKATPLALAGTALIALGFALKARLEERFLAEELGPAGYAAYARRVPMLVPFAPR